jgi:hypothetical protein
MALQVAFSTVGGPVQFQLGEVDNLVVPAQISVISTQTNAIEASGTNQSIRIFGLVDSDNRAIAMSNSNPDVNTGYYVYVGSTGIINAAGTGVSMGGGSNLLSNFGEISGNVDGISIYNQSAPAGSTVRNYGKISGDLNAAIDINNINSSAPSKIFNFGIIDSNNDAIQGFSGEA